MTASVIDTLKTELETFENNRDELLEIATGQYALVHGEVLLGTYKDETDAIAEGYKQLGNVPFLVQLIAQEETPANFANNHLGI